jgi:hypothetical protein
MRTNPDLDDFMSETETTPVRRRRRKSPVLKSDAVRRRAFKVLAILADLDIKTRERVLKKAINLSKA